MDAFISIYVTTKWGVGPQHVWYQYALKAVNKSVAYRLGCMWKLSCWCVGALRRAWITRGRTKVPKWQSLVPACAAWSLTILQKLSVMLTTPPLVRVFPNVGFLGFLSYKTVFSRFNSFSIIPMTLVTKSLSACWRGQGACWCPCYYELLGASAVASLFTDLTHSSIHDSWLTTFS
jgi:hypothetical protein